MRHSPLPLSSKVLARSAGVSALLATVLPGQEPEHDTFLQRYERHRAEVMTSLQWFPDADLRQASGTFDLSTLAADLKFALPVSGATSLELGGRVAERRYETHDLGSFGDESLYEVSLRLGVRTFVSDDFLLEAQVEPGLWSDLDRRIGSADWDMPMRLLATDRLSPDFFLRFGLRYNTIFPRRFVLPNLGIAWMPVETVRVDVLAPESAEVSVWPSPAVGILLGAEFQGARYNLHFGSGATEGEGSLRLQEAVAYLGLAWQATRHELFEMKIGTTVGGENRIDDTPGPSRVDGTLTPGLFLEIGFGFDI